MHHIMYLQCNVTHTHTPCMIAKTNNTKMLRRGQCDSCGVLPSFGHSAQGTPGRHVIQLHQSSASCGQCKQRNTWHPMVSNLCCIFPVGLLPQEKITTTYPPIAFFSGTIFLGDKPTGKLLGRSISWHARNLQWSRKYHQTRYDIVHRFRYDMIIGSQEKMHDMSNHTHIHHCVDKWDRGHLNLPSSFVDRFSNHWFVALLLTGRQLGLQLFGGHLLQPLRPGPHQMNGHRHNCSGTKQWCLFLV